MDARRREEVLRVRSLRARGGFVENAATAELSKRQREVLDAIVALVDEEGIPPTVREIVERIGLKSSNSITPYLDALEAKGFIARREGIARGIRVLVRP
jgi:repressor LexA